MKKSERDNLMGILSTVKLDEALKQMLGEVISEGKLYNIANFSARFELLNQEKRLEQFQKPVGWIGTLWESGYIRRGFILFLSRFSNE